MEVNKKHGQQFNFFSYILGCNYQKNKLFIFLNFLNLLFFKL